MKKFKYRLEPVLRWRRQQEDEKKRAVGALVQAIHQEQQEALKLASDLQTEGDALQQQYRSGDVDVDFVGHYFRYAYQVRQAIAQHVRNVTGIQKQLAAARSELSQAAQRSKILEKLKEKQQHSYQRQIQRREAAYIDELGMQNYIRRRQNEDIKVN